ncbi:MAG: hypothetical protein Q8O88_02265 [bacterium]|nr:hypothetical protein [bacterium]
MNNIIRNGIVALIAPIIVILFSLKLDSYTYIVAAFAFITSFLINILISFFLKRFLGV